MQLINKPDNIKERNQNKSMYDIIYTFKQYSDPNNENMVAG